MGAPAKLPVPTFQAERGLLSCLLNYPELIGEPLMPPPRMYKEPRHQRLAEVIFELFSRGVEPETPAIASHPAFADELLIFSSTEEIRDLWPARHSWHFYAEIVRDDYEARELRSAMGESQAHLDAGDLAGARAMLVGALDILLDERPRVRTFAQLHRELAEMAEEAFSRGGDDPGIPLPWSSLNRLLGGLGDGELSVVAGVPGGGKSVFALQLAECAARRGPVLVYSLEMRGIDLAARSITRRLRAEDGIRMSIREIEGGRFKSPEEWRALIRIVQQVEQEGNELIIDDSPALTVGEIAQRARAEDRRARERHSSKRGLRLIVIDYAQLVQSSGTYDARHEEIANAVLGFKALARRLNCPVLLLSQFDTEGMSIVNRGGIPDMSRIAGSKDIGKHTDVLIYLLWEKGQNGGRSLRDGSFHVDKNRQGGLGSVPFSFDGEKMEFHEIERRDYGK